MPWFLSSTRQPSGTNDTLFICRHGYNCLTVGLGGGLSVEFYMHPKMSTIGRYTGAINAGHLAAAAPRATDSHVMLYHARGRTREIDQYI